MKLKGSYTVEAAVIISFCFILFGMAIGVAYELFQITLEYVKYKEGNFDAVNLFRLKEGLVGIYHAIKE
ncbi:hypothetical protein SAMN02910413_1932 [Pseudobutyrivibrio sp. C4]|uniref:hypothetical protein n=1 Tax=unclassified Pseudobutyrivibrio TaxID=2638619 RepID=UPI0008BFC296|nr:MULTISPECIES: hypothetical protein [unclassified Pseudobutyrivibrio]SET14137.1 hypothetical protein SAMN02910413_1932 [Pseudobutyrivibrio sp. C4]SFO39557.1 hypothetical protein SAMN05216351_10887 [Pseudobutyrivibrio sp. JW11]